MWDSVRIIIPGVPVAKGRGRIGNVTTASGKSFNTIFTPAKTRQNENLIKMTAGREMAGKMIYAQAVSVQVYVFIAIPKSMPKKERLLIADGKLRPTKKPDIDNYVKSALDGINGIVIQDDNQVVELFSSKRYSENPRLEIIVKRVTL